MMFTVSLITHFMPKIYCFKRCNNKKEPEPWLVQLSGLSAGCEPKGRQFNSQLGPMPGLWAGSPVWGTQEATTHWCFSPSLSPSLPLSLQKWINKIFKKKKNLRWVFIQNSSGVRVRFTSKLSLLHLIVKLQVSFFQMRLFRVEKWPEFLTEDDSDCEAAASFHSHLVFRLFYVAKLVLTATTAVFSCPFEVCGMPAVWGAWWRRNLSLWFLVRQERWARASSKLNLQRSSRVWEPRSILQCAKACNPPHAPVGTGLRSHPSHGPLSSKISSLCPPSVSCSLPGNSGNWSYLSGASWWHSLEDLL